MLYVTKLYHVYHETFKLGDPTDQVEHDDGVHVGLVTATVVPEAAAAAADNEEHYCPRCSS